MTIYNTCLCTQGCPRFSSTADIPKPPLWDTTQEHDGMRSPAYIANASAQALRCWWAKEAAPVYEWRPYECRYPLLRDAELGQCLRRLNISSVRYELCVT
jgi:hypothetical protein